MSGVLTKMNDQVACPATIDGAAEVVGAAEVAEEVPEPCSCDVGWSLSAGSPCMCCGAEWDTWRRANWHRNNK